MSWLEINHPQAHQHLETRCSAAFQDGLLFIRVNSDEIMLRAAPSDLWPEEGRYCGLGILMKLDDSDLPTQVLFLKRAYQSLLNYSDPAREASVLLAPKLTEALALLQSWLPENTNGPWFDFMPGINGLLFRVLIGDFVDKKTAEDFFRQQADKRLAENKADLAVFAEFEREVQQSIYGLAPLLGKIDEITFALEKTNKGVKIIGRILT